MGILQDLEGLFNRGKADVADVVRTAMTDAEAALKADTPELQAAAKVAAQAIIAAVEAALQAKGL